MTRRWSGVPTVRQVTRTRRVADDRFRLVVERPMALDRGFSFRSSADMTASEVVDALVKVGCSVRQASRAIENARRYFRRIQGRPSLSDTGRAPSSLN